MLCASAVEHIKPHAFLHPRVKAMLFDHKMRLFGLFLLLLVFESATSIPISDKDNEGIRRVQRSAGFGETVRDWIRTVKSQIVEKWQEWFGEDSSTMNLSPQDILNIDKTIESRVPNYPGLFLDLSDLSFDPKQDWGVRVGNWYVIRKITGDNYDSDKGEWDTKMLVPGLPALPDFDWVSSVFEVPGIVQSSTTTLKIGLTTTEQQTPRTVPRTEPILPSTESSAFTTEFTVPSDEPILTTQLISTSSEPTSTQEIVTSGESFLMTDEPLSLGSTPTESIATSIESFTTAESVTTLVNSTIPSTEVIPISAMPNATFDETDVAIIESIDMMSTEETTTTVTTTGSVATTFALPIVNKRIEDNETVNRHTTRKSRPASAEVIMF